VEVLVLGLRNTPSGLTALAPSRHSAAPRALASAWTVREVPTPYRRVPPAMYNAREPRVDHGLECCALGGER
jgi:hypothetical protein